MHLLSRHLSSPATSRTAYPSSLIWGGHQSRPTHPGKDFRLMDEPPKGGYIKWFHKSLKHPLFKRPTVWHYFQFCVLRAGWSDSPTRVEVKGEEVVVQRGQFVAALRNDAKATGLTYQQIRTCRRLLEKFGILTLQSTHLYTLITVCKYELYQDRQHATQHATQHTTNTLPTHYQHNNKNVKNVKKVKINKRATGVGDFRGAKRGLSPEAQVFKQLLEKRSKENEKSQSQRG